MDYNENTMAGAYRCVLFAASGDGNISADEIEDATLASEGTEMWYEGYYGMMNILDDAFDNLLGGLLGEEEEEEEKEEEKDEKLQLIPLEKDQIKEIADDVLSNIDKCTGVSDIKAYASICASTVPEAVDTHIINIF